MIFLIVFLACVFVALGFGFMAAMSDYRGMVIPNVFSLAIFGAFVVCYGGMAIGGYADQIFAPVLSHVIGFALVFLVTLGMFFAGVWGGGDQKMLSAFSVWVGFSWLPAFLVYTALFGGVLALVAIILKRWKPMKKPAQGSWVEQVQSGSGKVPYGIAIMLGALASFVKIGYLDMDTFRVFL